MFAVSLVIFLACNIARKIVSCAIDLLVYIYICTYLPKQATLIQFLFDQVTISWIYKLLKIYHHTRL